MNTGRIENHAFYLGSCPLCGGQVWEGASVICHGCAHMWDSRAEFDKVMEFTAKLGIRPKHAIFSEILFGKLADGE